MATLAIKRVNTIPVVKAVNTMYIGKSAEAGEAEVVFVGMTVSDIYTVPTTAAIQALINTSLNSVNAPESFADITERDAFAGTDANLMGLVLDATGDATVDAGGALYFGKWNGTSVDWTKVAEYESMDVTVTWASISGTPTSTVAEIDASVTYTQADALVAVTHATPEW